jgi:hypothetical protein
MDIPLPFYLLPLLLIIVIPAAIARENEVLLSRIPLVSVAKLLTMAVLVFLALAVIRRLLVSTGAGAAFGHVIEFVLFFVVVTGFFFPVVRGPAWLRRPKLKSALSTWRSVSLSQS